MLQRIDPSIGGAALERLETTGLTAGQIFLETLLDDLADLPPSVLVLEDLHFITNSALLDELSQLFERAPAQLRFVVSARSDPMLTLQRLRVRGEVAELRQDALALDAAEIDELVRQVGSVRLAEGQIARVVSRTEGWVAGVQLAALSMREATDLDEFVD